MLLRILHVKPYIIGISLMGLCYINIYTKYNCYLSRQFITNKNTVIGDLQGGPKMAPFFVHLIISPNINQFSKLIYCQNQETIYNKTITTDLTNPQVCRYTTL